MRSRFGCDIFENCCWHRVILFVGTIINFIRSFVVMIRYCLYTVSRGCILSSRLLQNFIPQQSLLLITVVLAFLCAPASSASALASKWSPFKHFSDWNSFNSSSACLYCIVSTIFKHDTRVLRILWCLDVLLDRIPMGTVLDLKTGNIIKWKMWY